jgi:hypothetical protein
MFTHKSRTKLMAGVLAMLLVTGITSTVSAGDLVNDTKSAIAIQQGLRDPQTGVFTWSGTVVVQPGYAVTIADPYWYRYDTHVEDGKLTFSLPGAMTAGDPRDYFFLYGAEVRIDVVRK